MYNLSHIQPTWDAVDGHLSRRLAAMPIMPTHMTRDDLYGYLLLFSLLSCTLFFAVRKVTSSKSHLQDFRGPRWARHTRLWICKTLASTRSAQIFVDVNKTYGSVARIGPNHLLTSDPVLIRQILAVGSKWRRGPWFDALRIDPRVSNIVAERDNQDIQGLEAAVDERVAEFTERIDERWVSGPRSTKAFDIAKRIQFFTIDTITQLCFGKPMGFVETDSDRHDFIATIETQLPIAQHFTVLLFLNTVLMWCAAVPGLRRIVVPSSADKKGVGVMLSTCRQVIDGRLKGTEEEKPDMLGSFLKRGLSPDKAEMEIFITLYVWLSQSQHIY
ncbi:hypothetical protein NLG97_g770 [Lecanicillium saksenae]|uniref:Uncharacterized protein n=1 Tax=Lecanicillium saksenae TaxID=468837 RepID=A0ACC1R7D6_9HYPO|nr:hypothetical protein NLG97_g770 [Lecanicillium saksenae]